MEFWRGTPGRNAKKIASRGNRWYIGSQPRGKMEIPGDNYADPRTDPAAKVWQDRRSGLGARAWRSSSGRGERRADRGGNRPSRGGRRRNLLPLLLGVQPRQVGRLAGYRVEGAAREGVPDDESLYPRPGRHAGDADAGTEPAQAADGPPRPLADTWSELPERSGPVHPQGRRGGGAAEGEEGWQGTFCGLYRT